MSEDAASPDPAATPDAPAADAAAEQAWLDNEITVDGRPMTVRQAQSRLAEANSRMGELEQQQLEMRTFQDTYKWAPDVQSEYQNNPEFRRLIDDHYSGQPADGNQRAQHGLTPESQEMRSMQVRMARFEQDQAFERLEVQGHEVTPEVRQRVLTEIHKNPALDVATAYKSTYFDQAMQNAKQQAVAGTADAMTKNRNAYSVPPGGSKAPAAKPDLSGMTQAEREAWGIQAIGQLDFGD